MKAVAFVTLCILMILHESVGNEILGKFDTSSSSSSSSESTKNGKSQKSSSSSAIKEYTSWEVKPDNSCIKRVVVEKNGVKSEDKVTPIDCAKAREEVRQMEEKVRIELEKQIKTLKKQQEELKKQHAAFARKMEAEFKNMKKTLKISA